MINYSLKLLGDDSQLVVSLVMTTGKTLMALAQAFMWAKILLAKMLWNFGFGECIFIL